MGLTGNIKYLLDTNIVIGRLKATSEVMALVSQSGFDFHNSAISQITRIELLGFAGMTDDEARDIKDFLDNCLVLFLDETVEQATIEIRRAHGIKLPDAIIVATAQVNSLELLTMDRRLQNVAKANK